nr:DUF5020 family protein [Bacteroidota bacterium]
MRYLLWINLLLLPFITFSQNLQLHYDFGKAYNGDTKIDRKYFTSTLEFFKIDSLGSTFLFVDVDYDKGNGGASLAYFEIARKFTLHKSGLSAQIEFNDGTPGYIIQAWLAGLSYPIKIGNFTLHTSLLYRANQGANSPDGQLTFAWYQPFLKNKFLFTGFFDLWSQDKSSGSGKDVVLLAEPQIWYILCDHFSFGGECEISRNFFTFDDDVEIMPTIGIKWNF